MNIIAKKLLIALLIALPTLAAAADVAPVSESKSLSLTPPPVPALTTAVAADKKPESTSAAQSIRMGYVDINRVGSESERGKALKVQLTAQKDKLQSKLDVKKKQLEKLKASIEAKIAQMTPQQRDAKAKEFQKKMEELQKLARSSEEDLLKLQDKETKGLYDEIEKAAIAHGTANKLAVVVVKRELLYVAPAVDAQDITDALIKAVNEAGQKK
ncbi:MAG: OmpH family outer membrane protein [Desulfuromonadaceae bacterium]|nr:OmpH family outer membrane protein [Desulfuromonadaceae bacterium]